MELLGVYGLCCVFFGEIRVGLEEKVLGVLVGFGSFVFVFLIVEFEFLFFRLRNLEVFLFGIVNLV